MSKAACQSAAPLPCKAQSRAGQPDRAADLCPYGTALPAEGRTRRLVITNLDELTIPQPSCFVNPLFQISNKNNRISGRRKSPKPSPSADNLRPKSRACGPVDLRNAPTGAVRRRRWRQQEILWQIVCEERSGECAICRKILSKEIHEGQETRHAAGYRSPHVWPSPWPSGSGASGPGVVISARNT